MYLHSIRNTRRASLLALAGLSVSALITSGCGSEVPAATSNLPVAVTVQEPTMSEVTPPVVSGAKLRFKTLTHDFGKVDDTDELHYEFEFTNEGDQTLEIGEIKPSCGCTTTELKKMVYWPGEEGAIELVFHPKGYGSQTKTITVKSNSRGSERIVVYIKSCVSPFVQFEPRTVRFDAVPSSEGREQEVTVTCRDPEAVFGSPQCTHPNFEVEWTSPPQNGSGKFRVRLKPGAAKGNVINKVKLDVQGTPKAGAASIRHAAEFSASAAVYGSIIVDPIFLSVGRVDPGGRIDKSVSLKRPNDQPFRILASELKNASPPNMQLSVTPDGAGWTVRIHWRSSTIASPALDESVPGKGILRTNLPSACPER